MNTREEGIVWNLFQPLSNPFWIWILFYGILEQPQAGREIEQHDLVRLTYFCFSIMLCDSSSLRSSWERLCWSREFNTDPSDLDRSPRVGAEWSHPGLQGMQLEFRAYLIFNALPGCFCIYLLFTWWIFILFISQLEKIQEVCLWKGRLVNITSFYLLRKGGI